MTLSISAAGAAQDPGPGISLELAQARAASLSDIRYDVEFELEQGMDLARGKVIVTFTIPDDGVRPIVLDFGGESLDALRVNGVEQPTVEQVHNHVLIAADDLDPGANRVAAEFTSRVAPTGTPLTIYTDQSRNEEFVYTLVVPADAHRLFPCFDQPDLKAVFSLRLTVPGDWVAVANGAEKGEPEITPEGRRRYEFEDTKPLSTYLMAFAAGTFAVRTSGDGVTSRLFTRQSQLADMETDSLFSMHIKSLAWLEDYFGVEYPFGKLDIVVLPGFPYGGMEHAGAIFYRESALVFDHAPTLGELLRRSTLIYHEVSHQWFGNLVTMHWFDDLWLKEGFATFIGYKALEALEPEQQAWLRFHQGVKPSAYRIDCTAGTTPVYQKLGNLADAKSAYGAIVYNKAPAVLRELHDRIGSVAFRDGVRLFLNEHAFGNARWNDLVTSFEQSSGESLAAWSSSWILSPSMPSVSAEWRDDGTGKVASFEIVQQNVQGGDETWPLGVDILWIDANGNAETIRVMADASRVRVAEVEGRPVPAAVLLNPEDVAYGQFLLDPVSQQYWLDHLPGEDNALRRSIALSALWDSVREASLDPRQFADLLLLLLETERDPQSQSWMLSALGTLIARYLGDEDGIARAEAVTDLLMAQLRRNEAVSPLQVFRFLTRYGSDAVQTLCEQALDDEEIGARLGIGERDRYLALSRLIAMSKAGERIGQMTGENTPPGSERHAFLALASFANAETKADYFERYLNRDEPPEQWIQASLAHFHWPGQSELTLPYLQRALEQVEWVKQNRKIFFMPAWLDAFINSHNSREALEVVETFLAEHPELSDDIVKKIQQSLDGLHRAVTIRERWQ